jgi:two-component system, OmpR family, sensor histidine kinase TctE
VLRPKPLSLRVRLASIMAALFVLGMVALYLAAQSYGRAAADRSFDRLLAGSAISITETVSIVDSDISVDLPYAALDMLSAAPDDRVFYRVIGPSNRTITGYADLPAPPMPAFGAPPSETIRFFDAEYRGATVRFAVVGREIAVGRASGWVWVQVGQTRLAREAVARETVIGALVPIAAMTVLALGAVWFGIGGALRPLRRVGDELAGRRPADLRPIIAPVPAELRPLVDAMNGFMRRLSENIETLKSFIADASHQMRTPLAALLAQAQSAHDDKPRELRRSLDAIERNGAKLAHLLNQLLSDATVAHRADVQRFEDIDLLEILQEAIRETAGISEGSDVRLRTRLDAAPLSGDRLVLIEAFKNVIHNAMRHGGAGECVEIELNRDDADYEVHVSDRGPGIPEDQRDRVFERFARVNADSPGAGIGLAIVRRAVESHHGTVSLVDRRGGGLSVVVRLSHA